MKLPTVHSPTSAPSHSSPPVRAASTSAMGLRSRSATVCGSVRRKLSTASIVSGVRPKKAASAAVTMKKGNSVNNAR